ncbi:hypothetical protein ACEQPO_18540 [Bacillus sp. SL00103]
MARDPDPVLFFEQNVPTVSLKGEVPEEDYTLPIGKSRCETKAMISRSLHMASASILRYKQQTALRKTAFLRIFSI